MSDYSGLAEGQRFWIDNKAATLTSAGHTWPDYGGYRGHYPDYYWIVTFDGTGETKKFTSQYALAGSITFDPKSGYEIGDTMEIKRQGLDPDLRGILVEIDPTAEMWPYRIRAEGSETSVWFGLTEITKIHSVISRERAPKAVESLKKQIALKREELEALETALEVLQYASN